MFRASSFVIRLSLIVNLSPEDKIAGVLTPLFALRHDNDLGIGDVATLRELIVWAREDRFFKLRFARRLAAELPNARLIEIDDSFTFVPEDQPDRLAELIAGFVRESPRAPREEGASG